MPAFFCFHYSIFWCAKEHQHIVVMFVLFQSLVACDAVSQAITDQQQIVTFSKFILNV